MDKNIVLIGMMGSGKTTVGRELSLHMPDYTYIDIDEFIEKENNLKVSEIFAYFGENHFRKLEVNKIIELAPVTKQIISLGGGAFENEESREYLLGNSYVIYLKATPETIYNRIKDDVSRPLLAYDCSVEKISQIINNRQTNYEKAHYTIDTTNKSIDNIIKETLGAINA